ncbi:hypothetical protein ABBQ38_005768 [Trebouxia sp. C0009 RCD-2024]
MGYTSRQPSRAEMGGTELHTSHQPCNLHTRSSLVRKSLLLASRLKHQQTKATAANDLQWLKQAQPLHKQHERGSQRLCVQSYSTDDYLDSLDDDWTDDEIDIACATADTATSGCKPMQAIAMPRKKAGAGRKQSAGQLRSVRLKDGTKAWRSKSEVEANTPPPRYTGVGDYNKRMKAAGILADQGVMRYEDTLGGKLTVAQQFVLQQQRNQKQREKDREQEELERQMKQAQLRREQEESEAQQSDTWDERGAVQAQKEVLIDEFVPGFDWEEFDDAAAELKDTLAPAVMMEDEEGKAAIKQLYSKSKAIELAKSGLVLADLRATPAGSLYGDTVWRFSQSPKLSTKKALLPATATTAATAAAAHGRPSAGLSGTQGRTATRSHRGSARSSSGNGKVPAGSNQRASATRLGVNGKVPAPELNAELPFNRFKAGEGVLISHQAAQTDISSFSGTILEVKKTHVSAVLDANQSALLASFIKGYGKMPKFRLDKQALEATTARQLKALDKLTYLHSINQAKAGGIGKRSKEDLRQQLVAELSVKKILLGLGTRESLQQYALQQPVWATGGSSRAEGERWRQEAGKLVRSMPNLNRSQQEAVAKAIFRRFTLWQGPPGTGKTRTLLAFMEVMVKTPSMIFPFAPILACADTNAAVDNIVEGLVQRGVKVVRLGQPAKVRADVRGSCLEAFCEKTVEGKRAIQMRKDADRMLERCDQGGMQYERLTPEEVQQMLQQAKSLQSNARKLIKRASCDVLQNCQVVASTCAGAGDESRLNGQIFRLVVIDEATQATEPSTLIPLMRGAESVVMAGDPRQLPPTVVSRGAEEAGLQVTLFDRLQRSGVEPLLLDTQYRMHPLIAHMPSKLFYGGRLQSGVTAAERPLPVGFPWPNPTCPVALVPCDFGQEQTGQASRTTLIAGGPAAVAGDVAEGGASFKNEIEADLAIRALLMLLKGGDVKSAAILSPYNGQVRELQRCFNQTKELAPYAGMVDISSVDGYQGREADVIVMSTVRCNREGKLGFVTDPRRLNVAISRPRRGLVVVGSPKTLWANDNWFKWLEWVKENKAVLHSDRIQQSVDCVPGI